MSPNLGRLYEAAVRHGIDPMTGRSLNPPQQPDPKHMRPICSAWETYIVGRPKSENTLAAANAFVAGWLTRDRDAG